ncbi:MAG: hypothetical protein J0G94_18210 [Sphingomonadales bacterium]|nr:hypothetical protein [Sphingomonadales bacterium]
MLVGAGAFLFLRRRDRREDALDDGYAPTTAVRAPATIVAERKRPLAQPEPVAAAPAHPASAMPTIGTEPGAESPTATPALANGSFGERFPELEAMVAAPPSPENPFRTRAKRLRRAAFIHARSHAPKRADVTNDSAQAPAPVREAERQPVYNFGTTRSYRPKNWKPITT